MSDNERPEDLWGYAKRVRFIHRAIKDVFPDRSPSSIRILDVGCGSGTQLGVPLAAMGYRLTGVDSHAPSIDVAAALAEQYSNAEFICGRVEDIYRHDFDVVILSEVLEHVADPGQLLDSSLAHMGHDGLAIITVPNGYGEFEWDSWVFRVSGFERIVERYAARRAGMNGAQGPVSSTENQDDRHIQFFTLRRLRAMFAVHGLGIVHQAGSTFLSGPFAGHLLSRFAGFLDWNSDVADRLPMSLASGWYFALRREVDK